MRSIFDQYEQPENQLTHALVWAMCEDHFLLRRFIKDIARIKIPHKNRLVIVEQQVPGEENHYPKEEAEVRGIPDAWIYDGSGWALLIESKVQAALKLDQLKRHLRVAEQRGCHDVHLLLIGTNSPKFLLPANTRFVSWPTIYKWLMRQTSGWARRVAFYLEIWEEKMVSKGYLKNITITSFSGIPFGMNVPYSYVRAKLCLNSLMEQLRNHNGLNAIYKIDKSQGRGQITGMEGTYVWDYIPFAENNEKNFTAHPHLTFVIRPDWTQVQITLPNSAKAKYWKKISKDKDNIRQLLLKIHKNLKKGRPKPPSQVKLWIEVLQRHYPYQKHYGIRDGELYFDVDCLLQSNKIESKVKTSDSWLAALLFILENRRKTNTQLAIIARYDHVSGSIVSKPEFVNEAVRALHALKPFYEKIHDC